MLSRRDEEWGGVEPFKRCGDASVTSSSPLSRTLSASSSSDTTGDATQDTTGDVPQEVVQEVVQEDAVREVDALIASYLN